MFLFKIFYLLNSLKGRRADWGDRFLSSVGQPRLNKFIGWYDSSGQIDKMLVQHVHQHQMRVGMGGEVSIPLLDLQMVCEVYHWALGWYHGYLASLQTSLGRVVTISKSANSHHIFLFINAECLHGVDQVYALTAIHTVSQTFIWNIFVTFPPSLFPYSL